MLKVHSLVRDRSQLVRSEALLVEAINATVSTDFPGAIKAYRELVSLTPNDPQVYVDLGRAYEKNDELKDALGSYVEATNHPPQYANAFLRVAIQYAEQADQRSAIGNFNNAQTLFEAAGNFEGQAEVAYQRGSLFDKLKRKVEAKQNLERALELSRASSNQYQEVKTLLKLGNVASDEVEPDKARELINQAISTARANAIDTQVKRGLVDLGNTYHATGKYEEAEKHFLESLQLSQQQKDKRNAARALLSLGSNSLRQSKVDEAIKYIEQALPFYQQAGYRREALQALALLARAKFQNGDYQAARHDYEEQLKMAQQLGDMAQMQLTLNDVGLTFALQGRYPEALNRFEESYAIAKSLKDEKNVGLCLINRINSLGKLGRNEDARPLYSEVASIAQRPNAAPNLTAAFYLSEALAELRQRNWPQTKTRAEKVIELAGNQYKNIVAEASYTLCLANTYSGAHVEGRRRCESALTRARETRNPSHEAEALLAYSQLLLLTGDTDGALKNSLEAQKIFSNVGKQDSEWIAFLIAARASKAQYSTAREYASRADQILAGLEQQWGTTNYQAYLARPDINLLRLQLEKLLAQKP
jgi:tetratricopeptide (TPR) repeat protein